MSSWAFARVTSIRFVQTFLLQGAGPCTNCPGLPTLGPAQTAQACPLWASTFVSVILPPSDKLLVSVTAKKKKKVSFGSSLVLFQGPTVNLRTQLWPTAEHRSLSSVSPQKGRRDSWPQPAAACWHQGPSVALAPPTALGRLGGRNSKAKYPL